MSSWPILFRSRSAKSFMIMMAMAFFRYMGLSSSTITGFPAILSFLFFSSICCFILPARYKLLQNQRIHMLRIRKSISGLWTYLWPPRQSPYRRLSSLSPQGQSCIQRHGYQAHHCQGEGQLLPGPLHCVKCHLRSLLVLRVLVWMNLSLQ